MEQQDGLTESTIFELSETYAHQAALQGVEIEPGETGQIERAKREWEVTVDSLPQLICLVDHEKRILRANRTLERWQLGQVMTVKGRPVHQFLHNGCTDPQCYLILFLEQAWQQLAAGQLAECEIEDESLKRCLHLQLQPLSAHTDGIDKTDASFAVLILEDVTEQKQAEAALEQYARELKARNEELDAFAHTVAHNLKGPLVPIIGFAELLETRYETTPTETIKEDLQAIYRNAYKISKIIDELLLLAGVREAEIEMKPLDMAAIMAEVQQRLAYMIEEYRADIILPTTWPVALGHGPWVEEVWTNYFSNAIKYGGRPPRLELGATLLAKPKRMIRFWIHDNGPGLKPEEQARLFTPFTKLNQAQGSGYGLGLSIVRRIVEKLDGQIGVTSEGMPGRGCVFSFMLPTA